MEFRGVGGDRGARESSSESGTLEGAMGGCYTGRAKGETGRAEAKKRDRSGATKATPVNAARPGECAAVLPSGAKDRVAQLAAKCIDYKDEKADVKEFENILISGVPIDVSLILITLCTATRGDNKRYKTAAMQHYQANLSVQSMTWPTIKAFVARRNAPILMKRLRNLERELRQS